MKGRLNASVETLLRHTAAPEPDLKFAKATQKQIFLSAVHGRFTKRAKSSGWSFGRRAITFAGVSLFVMIGAGTLLAQAGRARPGDRLYSLNRALESTQLAFTQNEANKLALKINFAEERLVAVTDSSTTAEHRVSVAAAEALDAVSTVDYELDTAKLALELNQNTSLTRQEVEQLSANFKTVLSGYQSSDLPSQEQAMDGLSESDRGSLDSVLSEINDLVEAELSQPSVEDGFYIQLSGTVATSGTSFTTVFGEHNLVLTGPLSQQLFANQGAEIRGALNGASLEPDQLQIGPYEFEIKNDGSVGFEASATLQQDETGFFFAADDNWRLGLSGELVNEEKLAELTGQMVKVEGRWADGGVVLNQVSAQTEHGEVVLPEQADSRTEDAGESLPAIDPAQPDIPPPGFDQ